MTTDRLLNELIDFHAKQHGWTNGWLVTGEKEIIILNVAGTVFGGIGAAGPSTINLAPVAGPSIIVITSLNLTVQLNAIINTNFIYGYNRLVKILKGQYSATNNNILAQPSDFEARPLFTNGTNWYYQFVLKTPEVFFLDALSVVGATALHSNPDTSTLSGWGKAIIISKKP